MPYVSDKQRRYFNWKAKKSKKWAKLAAEYNRASKGKKLPEKKSWKAWK